MTNLIIWTDYAELQLQLAYEFAYQQSPNYAEKMLVGILESTIQLLEFPLSGSIETRLNSLELEYRYVLYSYYKILYRVEEPNVVVIVNVFDTRQDPAKLRVG